VRKGEKDALIVNFRNELLSAREGKKKRARIEKEEKQRGSSKHLSQGERLSLSSKENLSFGKERKKKKKPQ